MLTVRPGLPNMFVLVKRICVVHAASGSHMLTTQELQDAIVNHQALQKPEECSSGQCLVCVEPAGIAKTMPNIGNAVGHLLDPSGYDAMRALQPLVTLNGDIAKAGFTPLSEIASEEAIRFFMWRNTGRFARDTDGESLHCYVTRTCLTSASPNSACISEVQHCRLWLK